MGQVNSDANNLVPGVTRFVSVAPLGDMNESAVACFQLNTAVQDRYGYCKVLRTNGTDLNASVDLVLNQGTSWNFALAPLSTGTVVVCYSDTAESEHAHCHGLMPGYGEATWRN